MTTFTDRIIVKAHPDPLPTCADCGAPSKIEQLNVTSFGDEYTTVIEMPTNTCPNGPHLYTKGTT